YRSPKPSKRRAEDVDLKQRILRIFAEFKQRYGVMKIHHELNLELQPLQTSVQPKTDFPAHEGTGYPLRYRQ
ncbi:IS3 family transposase, partial [Limosilactobacillus fermentum]